MKNRSTGVFIGALIMVAIHSGTYLTISNYVDPIGEMLNVTNQQISLMFTLRALSTTIFSILIPWILKKVRARIVIAAGAVFCMAFFFSIATAKSLLPIYICALLYGSTFPFCGLVMGQIQVSWWVKKNTGQALSMLVIVYSLFTFVISPVVASGIETLGIRNMAMVHGLVLGGVILLVDLLFSAEKPEFYEKAAAAERISEEEPDDGANVSAAYRTYPFWLMVVAMVIFNVATNGFGNNAAVFYKSIGATAIEASYGISIFSIVSVGWSYLYGFITDKKGAPAANTVLMATTAVILFASTVLRGLSGVIIIAIFMASNCIGGHMGAVTFTHVYGKKMGSSLIGIGGMVASVGSMMGAPLFATLHEVTGSYNGFMIVCAVGTSLSLLLIRLGSNKKAIDGVKKVMARAGRN